MLIDSGLFLGISQGLFESFRLLLDLDLALIMDLFVLHLFVLHLFILDLRDIVVIHVRILEGIFWFIYRVIDLRGL